MMKGADEVQLSAPFFASLKHAYFSSPQVFLIAGRAA